MPHPLKAPSSQSAGPSPSTNSLCKDSGSSQIGVTGSDLQSSWRSMCKLMQHFMLADRDGVGVNALGYRVVVCLSASWPKLHGEIKYSFCLISIFF